MRGQGTILWLGWEQSLAIQDLICVALPTGGTLLLQTEHFRSSADGVERIALADAAVGMHVAFQDHSVAVTRVPGGWKPGTQLVHEDETQTMWWLL